MTYTAYVCTVQAVIGSSHDAPPITMIEATLIELWVFKVDSVTFKMTVSKVCFCKIIAMLFRPTFLLLQRLRLNSPGEAP